MLDEADRFVAAGHFKELGYILSFIYKQRGSGIAKPTSTEEEEVTEHDGLKVVDLDTHQDVSNDKEEF